MSYKALSQELDQLQSLNLKSMNLSLKNAQLKLDNSSYLLKKRLELSNQVTVSSNADSTQVTASGNSGSTQVTVYRKKIEKEVE